MESTKPGLIVRACGHLCSGAGIQMSQLKCCACRAEEEGGPVEEDWCEHCQERRELAS
jgi:hypothetical protein